MTFSVLFIFYDVNIIMSFLECWYCRRRVEGSEWVLEEGEWKGQSGCWKRESGRRPDFIWRPMTFSVLFNFYDVNIIMSSLECWYCRRRVERSEWMLEEGEWQEAWLLGLRKAYPRVNKPGLWGLLERYGLGENMLRVVRGLHETTTYRMMGKEWVSGGYLRCVWERDAQHLRFCSMFIIRLLWGKWRCQGGRRVFHY